MKNDTFSSDINSNTVFKGVIGLASDHAGFILKEFIKHVLTKKGIPYKDFGAYGFESADYADFAHPLAYAIEKGEVCCGMATCGSGNGINITLNKHQEIRAALCWDAELAKLARSHNDANVLVMPGRFITPNEAEKCINNFLTTPFDGGRHSQRISKIPLNQKDN